MLVPSATLAEGLSASAAFEGSGARMLHEVVLKGVYIFELNAASNTVHHLVVTVRFFIQKPSLVD